VLIFVAPNALVGQVVRAHALVAGVFVSAN